MRKVFSSTETTGDPFNDVPSQFAVAIILPAGQTMPSNVYLEFAVGVKDGDAVSESDIVWKRRHPTPFTDDVGEGTSGNMIKFFNDVDGLKYRMVSDTAGIEAYVGTAL